MSSPLSAAALKVACAVVLAGCSSTSNGTVDGSTQGADAADRSVGAAPGTDAIADVADGGDGDVETSDGSHTHADRAAVPTLHRSTPAPCTQSRPPGTAGPGCGPPLDGGCKSDPDCDGGRDGRCNCMPPFGASTMPTNECTYDTCSSDTDCSSTVCHCREDPPAIYWGTQTFCFSSGNCRSDSDCGPGGYCSPSPSPGCGPGSWYGFFCHTASDECTNDGDCAQGNAYCAYDATRSHWICATGSCPDA